MTCKLFVSVITAKYLVSKYCKNELNVADGDNKAIFPVFFEDVDLDTSPGVKYIIAGLNWTKLRAQDGGHDPAAMEQLILAMKGVLRKVDAGTLNATTPETGSGALSAPSIQRTNTSSSSDLC